MLYFELSKCFANKLFYQLFSFRLQNVKRIYIYIYICVCVCVCVHRYYSKCIHMHTHACTHACTHTHTRTHTGTPTQEHSDYTKLNLHSLKQERFWWGLRQCSPISLQNTTGNADQLLMHSLCSVNNQTGDHIWMWETELTWRGKPGPTTWQWHTIL